MTYVPVTTATATGWTELARNRITAGENLISLLGGISVMVTFLSGAISGNNVKAFAAEVLRISE